MQIKFKLNKFFRFLIILFCLSANVRVFSQSLPEFRSPLDIPLYLSGNFGELRSNHFHTGIDIKTQGVEGKNIYAAEGGVVSRILVSPYGYGHALYIDHPNGYTTVYGHLKEFSGKIEKIVRKEQYEAQSFSVDFNPTPPIEVTKGEIIALSGNTGGSGGPHLHFEIRKTANQRPQNPLLFGFNIKDNIAPRIRGVRVHPLSDTTLINGKHEAQSFVVQGNAGKYHLKAGTEIKVYGAFGLSLHTRDYLNDQPNHCGIYTLTLKLNDEIICAQQFDELDFSTNRNINAYKDYEMFKRNKWHYHKSFVEPGNKLEIYHPEPVNHGIITYNDSGFKRVSYTVTDSYDNTSTLEFDIEALSLPNAPLPAVQPYDAYFTYGRPNDFEYLNELEIHLPEKALYKDLKFLFSRQMKQDDTYSPIYLIHNEDVPLQEHFEVRIQTTEVPKNLKDKILVQRSGIAGGTSYLTGTYSENLFVVKSRDFGKFTLVADTVAPQLTAGKWSNGGTVNNNTQLQFTVKDDKSGIHKYNAYLNGKWVLLQYEPKKKMLFMNVGESNFQKGKNILEIIVEDGCKNKTLQQFEYTY